MCDWDDCVVLVIDKKPVYVDKCIAPIVRALNSWGIRTVASCCGHKKTFGNIALEDGRELIICPDYKQARKLDKLIDINI